MRSTSVGLAWILLLALPVLAAGEDRSDSRRPAGWLGVALTQLQASTGDDVDAVPRVAVRFVVEDGPAARAGMRARDRIVSIDGVPVSTPQDVISKVMQLADGQWIQVTIQRAGAERDLRVRIGERPADPRAARMRRGWIGVETLDLPSALREHFGAPPDAGVMIAGFVEASAAEAAGFELGDVVVAVHGEPVMSASDLINKVAGAGVGNEVEFTVLRYGTELVLELVLPAAPRE
jgi:S1-C subfamily serine protease